MNECSQHKYIHNNTLKNSKEFRDDFFNEGLSLYEVVRILNSKPIFLQEHLDRLEKSAKKMEQIIWLSPTELTKKIELVIQENNLKEGNIKIVFNINETDRNFYCYFIKHSYPDKQKYLEGVHTTTYSAERSTPNVKAYDHKLRTDTNTIIDSSDIFEVILIDKLGYIREGSRSNIFFIKGNELITAPDNEVLNGIVRGKVIEISEKMGFNVIKEKVTYTELSNFDAAFLTGTSPQILPIKTINAISFNVNHHLLKQLLTAYRKELILDVGKNTNL